MSNVARINGITILHKRNVPATCQLRWLSIIEIRLPTVDGRTARVGNSYIQLVTVVPDVLAVDVTGDTAACRARTTGGAT